MVLSYGLGDLDRSTLAGFLAYVRDRMLPSTKARMTTKTRPLAQRAAASDVPVTEDTGGPDPPHS